MMNAWNSKSALSCPGR